MCLTTYEWFKLYGTNFNSIKIKDHFIFIELKFVYVQTVSYVKKNFFFINFKFNNIPN